LLIWIGDNSIKYYWKNSNKILLTINKNKREGTALFTDHSDKSKYQMRWPVSSVFRHLVTKKSNFSAILKPVLSHCHNCSQNLIEKDIPAQTLGIENNNFSMKINSHQYS
jgi:hypothetical protein